ncbi:kremen protein 1-like [Entelurus aequoreus]|uniref:kremen protein 1-like n=1 Tax=Entelurus aequoreus TaxID=161455 RepID=UPI002B1E3C2E|nr:kremen protein 1-like [Entelurus aequoreus]
MHICSGILVAIKAVALISVIGTESRVRPDVVLTRMGPGDGRIEVFGEGFMCQSGYEGGGLHLSSGTDIEYPGADRTETGRDHEYETTRKDLALVTLVDVWPSAGLLNGSFIFTLAARISIPHFSFPPQAGGAFKPHGTPLRLDSAPGKAQQVGLFRIQVSGVGTNVPSKIPECYTANGEDYRGFQNQTSLHGGKPCLFWNETFQHPYNTLKYPNGEGGLGRHNYCRNPDGDVQPWCYIADHEDGIYWRYCDIPTCRMPGNLGCFRDSGDPPALSGATETSNKLTIQNCISFCRKQRYKLAGMESGYACFCGNEVDLQDHDESPGMECNHVCFGDHTQPCGGDGWVIVFDTRVGSCGGNLTSPSGVIYSPDFPDKYGASRVCYWTVQVPGSSAILFNFTFFDISDQADMVELLNGYTNQVVARFDWRSPPREVVNITGDFVIVYFFSDRTNQAQGFALLYQALRSQSEEEEEDDDDGFLSTVAPPQPPATVTDRSNLTSKGRSTQILYVITSSPGKPEHNMPGQWAGPGETHNATHAPVQCHPHAAFSGASRPFLNVQAWLVRQEERYEGRGGGERSGRLMEKGGSRSEEDKEENGDEESESGHSTWVPSHAPRQRPVRMMRMSGE